jgi:hypothetical protein
VRALNVDPGRITDFVEYDPAYAIKFTILRDRPSGSAGDADIFGAQQYAPFLDVEVDMTRKVAGQGQGEKAQRAGHWKNTAKGRKAPRMTGQDTPTGLRFDKMHGAGNDFVVIDSRQRGAVVTAALARALGDRHRGVGFDQLAEIRGRIGRPRISTSTSGTATARWRAPAAMPRAAWRIG